MAVVINPLGMAAYFNSTTGPWGRYLARRADDVRDQAIQNASGPVIDIDTFDLVGSTIIQMEGRPDGARAQIGSTAEHRGARYPAFVTRQGDQPGGWLIKALQSEFPGAQVKNLV